MKVKESKFLRELREVARKPGDKPKYLWGKKEKRRGELERIGRFIQGSETRACKYWLKKEGRVCRLCKKEKKAVKHVIEACEVSGDSGRNWKQVIRGEGKTWLFYRR